MFFLKFSLIGTMSSLPKLITSRIDLPYTANNSEASIIRSDNPILTIVITRGEKIIILPCTKTLSQIFLVFDYVGEI